MRVIAGRFKGRQLKPPAWTGLRPTSDKLRETLFNILAPRVANARVLDGFAGTGAIGIEALSRGASYVMFVDRDRRAAALVEENLARCGIDSGFDVHRGNIVTVLSRLSPDQVFDIVVLDPPYDQPDIAPVLEAAARRLAPGGVLVLERATRREPDIPGTLARLRDVRSGDSTLTFLGHRN